MSTEVTSHTVDVEDIRLVPDTASSTAPSLSPTEEFYLHAIDGKLTRRRFMRRISTIRNLLLSHTLDVNELEQIWNSVIGDEDTCDMNEFMAVNNAIEEYLLYHDHVNALQTNTIILRASDIAACIGTF